MKKLFGGSDEKPSKELSILTWTGEVGSVFYQPRKTSEILRMNPTLRYFLSLTVKLASNQLHTSNLKCQTSDNKGTAEFLSRIILARLSHMEIKVFGSIFTTVMGKCRVITSLDDTNLNSF